MIIAILIGGKNDGAVIDLPTNIPQDVPSSIVIKYKQGKLLYDLQQVNTHEAVYEYTGIIDLNANCN